MAKKKEIISPDEPVLNQSVTYQRVIYPKLTQVKKLPDELQEIVKSRGFVSRYEDVFEATETNIDYKEKAEKLARKVASLQEALIKLQKQLDSYRAEKKEIKKEKEETKKDK